MNVRNLSTLETRLADCLLMIAVKVVLPRDPEGSWTFGLPHGEGAGPCGPAPVSHVDLQVATGFNRQRRLRAIRQRCRR